MASSVPATATPAAKGTLQDEIAGSQYEQLASAHPGRKPAWWLYTQRSDILPHCSWMNWSSSAASAAALRARVLFLGEARIVILRSARFCFFERCVGPVLPRIHLRQPPAAEVSAEPCTLGIG
jgi:hypothetical protein